MSGKRLGALALAAILLTAGPARAADKQAINDAIEKGVRKLKNLQGSNGTWAHVQIGLTALCGLTLLECDVPVDDLSVQRAAGAVRAAATETDDTYSIALCILFLDRLGEPVDQALIESLALRLLAGQTTQGDWSYKCPKAPAEEQRRLTALVDKRKDEGRPKELPKESGPKTTKDLSPEIRDQLDHLDRLRAAAAASRGGMKITGDNSNTQFAVLGLWVARRRGLPVDAALGETEKYLRASQEPAGGWPYSTVLGLQMPSPAAANMQSSSPAMTCAGLLGLGLAYGAWNEAALRTDPKKEPGKP
ncbi:MAG TPA: hypothetical protein VFW33_06735, partial [Gemmataceae bacterium]|nr:hypothetical protein [Gemmataceae bacterium]